MVTLERSDGGGGTYIDELEEEGGGAKEELDEAGFFALRRWFESSDCAVMHSMLKITSDTLLIKLKFLFIKVFINKDLYKFSLSILH